MVKRTFVGSEAFYITFINLRRARRRQIGIRLVP